MADSILCLHCGWYEADHTQSSDDEPKDGYNSSLNQCPGFEPDDPELARILEQKAEEDKLRRLRLLNIRTKTIPTITLLETGHNLRPVSLLFQGVQQNTHL